MSIEIEFKFEYQASFTEVPSGSINVDSLNGATLNLTNLNSQTFNYDFTNTTSFTVDTYAELSGSQLQQKDITPLDSTFFTALTNSIAPNWGSGTLTTSITAGSPTIVNSMLDLTGIDKRIVFGGVGTASTANQTGAMRVQYTPNYTGAPSANIYIMSAGDSTTASQLRVRHRTNNQVQLLARNPDTSIILNQNFAAWAPNSGQTYEIEVNYDFNGGDCRLFIDGSQLGPTRTGVGSRDSSQINLIGLGTDQAATSTFADAFFHNFIIFDTVQHTSGYTPTNSIPTTRYLESSQRLFTHTYSGIGGVQQFLEVGSTATESVGYTFNGLYYDGSSWTLADSTASQANDITTVNSNIRTLPNANAIYADVFFPTVNSQQSVSNFDIFYDGQHYRMDYPSIRPINSFFTDSVCNFVDSISVGSFSAVQYQLNANSTDYYHDGSSWTIASTTNQSNQSSHFASQLGQFDFSSGVRFFVRNILVSDSGDQTPTAYSYKFSYSFNGGEVSSFDLVSIFGYVYDTNGSPLQDVSVVAKLQDFGNFGNLQMTKSKNQSITNSYGYWELDIIPSDVLEPKNQYYNFVFSGQDINLIINKVVPNSESAAWGTF